jgi:hypothetical protein
MRMTSTLIKIFHTELIENITETQFVLFNAFIGTTRNRWYADSGPCCVQELHEGLLDLRVRVLKRSFARPARPHDVQQVCATATWLRLGEALFEALFEALSSQGSRGSITISKRQTSNGFVYCDVLRYFSLCVIL